MRKQFIFYIFSLIFIFKINAQDLRGGHIQYNCIGGNTYSITLTLYIDSAMSLNRTTVPMAYGDGTSHTATVASSYTTNGVIVNKYHVNHTYPGSGFYNITFNTLARVGGIVNMTFSLFETFYLNSSLYINQFAGPNSSPSLSGEFINIGISGNQFMINPGIYDTDGDSLSYSLDSCYTFGNYYLPTTANVNSMTGTFTFSKDSSDLHAFHYKITEWRKDFDGNYFQIGVSNVDFVTELKTSVGIEEQLKSNFISVSPNPSSGIINIRTTKSIRTVEIENALGQKIFISNGNNIDVSDLNNGIYYLKVIFDDNEIGVNKIVKE